jgi:hypothetical protein
VSPRDRRRCKNAHEYGDTPSKGDHDPSRVITIGSFEQYVGHYAIAKCEDECRSDDFGYKWGHEELSFTQYKESYSRFTAPPKKAALISTGQGK